MSAVLPKDHFEWSTDNLCSFLSNLSLNLSADIIHSFKDNKVKGADLPDLDQDALKQFGIAAWGDRNSLLKEFKKLEQERERKLQGLEGWLWKRGSATGSHRNVNWKRRFFIYKNEILSYYSKQPTTKNELKKFHKGDIKRKGLVLGEVASDVDVCGRTNCWKFIPAEGTKHFLLSADTEAEKELWLNFMDLPRATKKQITKARTDVLVTRGLALPDDIPMVRMEGWLYKRGAMTGAHARLNWKRRFFILREKGDLKYYTRKPKNLDEESSFLKGTIPLTGLKIGEVPPTTNVCGRQNVFKLVPNSTKHFLISANSADDLRLWLIALGAPDKIAEKDMLTDSDNAADDSDDEEDEVFSCEMWKRGSMTGSHKNSNWKRRFFVWSKKDQTLTYYAKKPSAPSEAQAFFKGSLTREGMRLGEVPPNTLVFGKCNCFKLMHPSGKHYLISADSIDDMDSLLFAMDFHRAPAEVLAKACTSSQAMEAPEQEAVGEDSDADDADTEADPEGETPGKTVKKMSLEGYNPISEGLCAGFLWKRGSLTGKHVRANWRWRYFVLREDALYYYSKKPTTDKEEKKFRKGFVTRVSGLRLGEVPPNTLVFGKCNCFKLMHPSGKHYLISAESAEDASRWLEKLGLPRANPTLVRRMEQGKEQALTEKSIDSSSSSVPTTSAPSSSTTTTPAAHSPPASGAGAGSESPPAAAPLNIYEAQELEDPPSSDDSGVDE